MIRPVVRLLQRALRALAAVKPGARRRAAPPGRDAAQAVAGAMAHELRHPLGQLKHSLERLQGVLPPTGAAPEAVRLDARQLRVLHQHLARGERAVERALQALAMAQDELDQRPPDAAAFRYLSAAEAVQHAVEEFSEDNEGARDRLAIEVVRDFTWKGDEAAFRFVLGTLIRHALQVAAAYPKTRVTVRVADHQVQVHDDGPGLPPDALDGLFEPLRRGGPGGASGLGLAYCRRVLRAFGGELRCASRVGEFTEFTLAFAPVPAQELEAHRREVVAQACTTLAGRRLLIVEDDPLQRSATRQKLGPIAAGTELEEAGDGPSALDRLASRRYDLVLLDLHMPGLDGYAVAQRIRQHPGPNRDVRIVAYTAEPAHLARSKTLQAGMDGFVSKPCAQLPLLAALQQAVLQSVDARGSAGRLAGRRILVADDSAFARKAVAAYLRGAAAIVIEVEHGRAVLEQLRSQDNVDAVVVDLHMPDMDGLETARAIRASRERWAEVPIVALTARSDEPAVAAASAAGMNGFLLKPVEAPLLYETLTRLITAGATRAVLPEPATPPTPAAPQDGLLNLQRLDSYRRLGMLDELLNDYLPEMARLVRKLREAVDSADVQGSLAALHSLLGMSGEAGAQALYQQVRRLYVPLLEEGQWPGGSAWLPQLEELARRTEQALRAYCGQRAPSGADGGRPGRP